MFSVCDWTKYFNSASDLVQGITGAINGGTNLSKFDTIIGDVMRNGMAAFMDFPTLLAEVQNFENIGDLFSAGKKVGEILKISLNQVQLAA